MALVLTVNHHWTDGKKLHIVGTVAATGNYTTGGLALSFNSTRIKSSRVPDDVDIQGLSNNFYKYLPGATRDVGKIKMLDSTGAEIAQAALPGGITGDTITVRATFKQLR